MREASSQPGFLLEWKGAAGGACRRPLLRSAVLLSSGLLALPADAVAGTGRLLTQWMTRAPRIDGQMTPAEWDETLQVDLGAGVTARFGSDGRTLYLGILDSGDLTHGPGDSVTLSLDDEGGGAPVLDDGTWGNPICRGAPDLGEGHVYFHADQSVRVDFSPSGTLLVSGGKNTVRVWKVSNGSLVRNLNGHTNMIIEVDFSPDGWLLASVAWDGTVRLWGLPGAIPAVTATPPA